MKEELKLFSISLHSILASWKEDHLIKPIKRYGALVLKEIKVLVNDKGAMIITYVIPLIVVLVLTIGSSGQIISTDDSSNSARINELFKNEIPIIGIIDYDQSEGFPDRDLSSDFVAKFQEAQTEGLCVLFETTNQSELEFLLGDGEINAFIIIPPMFEFNLSIHLPVIVPIVIDSINTVNLQSTQQIVDGIIQNFKQENDFTGVFKINKNLVNVPDKNQIFFAAAPYIIPLVIFGIGCLTSTQSIVSDIPKDRMVLTPTNKGEMMLAKVSANILIQMGVVIIFIITSLFVNLQIMSNYFMYFIVLFLMEINAVLIGVAISAISKTPLTAYQYFIFIFIFQIVAILFIENPMILMTMPLYNGYQLLLQIVLRGQNIWSVRMNLFSLAVESLIIYLIGYVVFKIQKTML
ncbi:ABC transporter permease [Candidatus Harpocratesius sp.]